MVADIQVSLRPSREGRGFNCIIQNNAEVARLLQERYGRPGLCLKIIKRKRPVQMTEEEDRKTWGPEPACSLVDCCRVQNLYAWEGLAPRVYDIAQINGEFPALVTDYVPGERRVNASRQRRCLELADELGLYPHSHKTFRHKPNWVAGQFVDFGSCCWAPNKKERYRQDLTRRLVKSNRGKKVYQPVPELGITNARRDMEHRLGVMGLQNEVFAQKTVLDLGCSLGWLCRYAAEHGATRVVGVDSQQARLAYEASNWLQYWNIDYVRARLPTTAVHLSKRTGLGKFDVIFALAIIKWAPGIRWVSKLLKEGGVAYFESHDLRAEELPLAVLRREFKTVKKLGVTTDLGKRVVWRCVK